MVLFRQGSCVRKWVWGGWVPGVCGGESGSCHRQVYAVDCGRPPGASW